MSKKEAELSRQEKSEFLDFLYTFNEHLQLMDKNNEIFKKILNPYSYNSPVQLSNIRYFKDDYDLDCTNPAQLICLTVDPEMKLKTFDAIISEINFSLEKGIEHGYYDDVSAQIDISFYPYALFNSLKTRELLVDKLQECPNKKCLEPVLPKANKKSITPSI